MQPLMSANDPKQTSGNSDKSFRLSKNTAGTVRGDSQLAAKALHTGRGFDSESTAT
jgi:hypothetical protein